MHKDDNDGKKILWLVKDYDEKMSRTQFSIK
jgi:hypothetical protein